MKTEHMSNRKFSAFCNIISETGWFAENEEKSKVHIWDNNMNNLRDNLANISAGGSFSY